jgi:hypothetical protein
MYRLTKGMIVDAPNFRIVNVCRDCEHLVYREENIPQQSMVCNKNGNILSNYLCLDGLLQGVYLYF